MGASAIIDRRDVIPLALARTGGEVEHLGMPVDLDNLLMLGRLHTSHVLGLPSCSRSPKFNGFDLVLNHLAAGIDVSNADAIRVGVGGLLQEASERPAPRVAGLVLAASPATRMDEISKLRAEVQREPMAHRVTQAALVPKLDRVIAVIGHEAEAVGEALNGLELELGHNPKYPVGLSNSLVVRLQVVPDDVDGVLVCLGDIPGVSSQIIDSLLAAFGPDAGREICILTWHGRWGNPVLIGRHFFPELLGLTGDHGARRLLSEHFDAVCKVEVTDETVLVDVDTLSALAKLQELKEVADGNLDESR